MCGSHESTAVIHDSPSKRQTSMLGRIGTELRQHAPFTAFGALTGIAIAFVSDQRYYDTIYQERYMGLPDDNAEGYKKGSPITFAHQLQGNLLLVHGTADDNVHYQNFEALVNELIKHGKHFSMMAYPNRTHSIKEGENTKVHLYTLLTRYLGENLPTAAEPSVP